MARVRVNSSQPLHAEYLILCPGCKCPHSLSASLIGRSFKFNGNVDRPTFTPEIHLKVGPFRAGHKLEGQTVSCHFRIRDGLIRYFHDSTHDLRLQTVGLPDFDELEAMRQARAQAAADFQKAQALAPAVD